MSLEVKLLTRLLAEANKTRVASQSLLPVVLLKVHVHHVANEIEKMR